MTMTGEVDRGFPKARTRTRRLVLIDDHPIVREGIRRLVQDCPDLEVADEAGDAAAGLAAVREQHPDLVFVDVSLGRRSGLDLIKQLRSEFKDLRILVFSMHDEELYAERSLRAGADGYLHKSAASEVLVDATRTLLSGGTWLSPKMTERLVHQAVHDSGSDSGGVTSLSDRELEVFQLIGAGLSTRRIAERLSISIKTVETHRENIKRKLDIDNAAELTRFAVAFVENPS